ncbi:MAG: aminodeoxychorismate synthase component I [Gammaproteobacteria bacterium]|nr:aminodeoxychorismate synthase component I [Gammaproteobacteria bacterium]
MRLVELEYTRDSAALFSPIAAEPWSIFLDSGYPRIDSGRYDIMSARPSGMLLTYGEQTRIIRGNAVRHSNEDPFTLLRQELGERRVNLSGFPFAGGALGYFAYDLGRRLECLPTHCRDDINMPDLAVGLYDWALIVDHHRRRTWLIAAEGAALSAAEWEELQGLFSRADPQPTRDYAVQSGLIKHTGKEQYQAAFTRLQRYIRDGDCYQVNLAQRFSIEVTGDSWSLYQRLRQLNPAPYSCFFRLDDGCILSSSPERFICVSGDLVETKPIKGTIRRSVYAYEDKALAAQLLESEKDRAENLMIVDLLRHDIGKNCETGSVRVPQLFALESFASVHHLVSTVTGRLARGRHALDLLRGAFPGGSITGAPKLRAMEIIEELEIWRRSVYCGAIGYIGFDGSMDTNIAIRTLVHKDDRVWFWAGGGIVADSTPESEYRECFEKAAAIMRLFD